MTRGRVQQAVSGFVLILVGIAPALATGQIVYVDDGAPPGGNGRTWATAYQHLQDVLVPLKARSSDAPVAVRVAQGIYRPDRGKAAPLGTGDRNAAFELTWGVQVSGGYAGIGATDPNERDVVKYRTILSGDLAGNDMAVPDVRRLEGEVTRADNSRHVVVMFCPAILDGVTITAGHARASDEILIYGDLATGVGGGLLAVGKGITIRDCVFTANFAADQGGGLYGGERAEALLVGCTLRGNQAAWGGAIDSFGCQQIELVNCLLVANMALEGGGAIRNQGGAATIRNCTAAANGAAVGRFLSDDTPRPGRGKEPPLIRVENCILADGDNEMSNGYAALTLEYTDITGGKAAVSDPRHAVLWGPGNLDADPCFADAGHWKANGTPGDPNDDVFVTGDYHLKSRAGRWDPASQGWVQDAVSSPCIDAGDPAAPFDLEPAPNGSRIDMGFYGGTAEAGKSEYTWSFMTTQGPLLAEGLGVVLPHEHIFTDLRGPTVAGYGQADAAEVVRVMKPWLVAAGQKGVGVLFECSSIGVGRNVPIVDQAARESGLPVVVPTGVYGRDTFAPPEHRSMSEDELAALFMREIREGIEGTAVKAGFIKIATGSSTMTALEEKILRAAGRAALETGAAIASHTPLGSNASRQVAILESLRAGIRFIWVHAQNESNRDLYRQLAARGVYIEFDSLGSNPGQDSTLIGAIKDLLAAGYGGHILLSHDAGYYQPGQANGGTQRSYTYLIEAFLPKLRAAGVDDATIRMLTEINPIRALGFQSGQ